MPPYAGQYDVDTVGADNGGATEYADVVVVEPTKPAAVVEHDNTDTDSQSGNSSSAGSHFEMLLDFNPCAAMTSAVFKLRNCSHCGNGCTKVSLGRARAFVDDVCCLLYVACIRRERPRLQLGPPARNILRLTKYPPLRLFVFASRSSFLAF